MTRRILALAGVHAAAGVLILALASHGGAPRGIGTTPGEVVGFATLFAAAGFLPIHVEFRRSSFSVVLDEAVWVVALFAMGPVGVVGSAIAGDAVSLLARRQSPLKAAYNLASMFLAASVGVTVFAALAPSGSGDPRSWLAALVAMAALSGCSLTSISVVLAMVEARHPGHVALASAGAQVVATGANASIGLATVMLLRAGTLGPLVLVPLVGAVVLGSRRQALQAAQHLRFERLYAAAARTGRLAGLDDALVTLAGEARTLLTGSVAMCCAARGAGQWAGVRVDDSGSAPADPAAVSALVGLARQGETRCVPLAPLPRSVRDALPAAADLVVSVPAVAGKAEVVLAVFREISPDEQSQGRVEVLGAFSGHAALIIANALLYEEVEEALHRQIDLNRQKSDFVAAVSHELRTPLTTVLGAVSTVRRLHGRLEPSAHEELLGRALEQGHRLRRLIDELLVVAAADHGALQATMSPFDVGRLAEAVCTEMGHGAGNSRLRLDVSPATGTIATDEDKVRRILVNLVENAIKYAPDGPIDVRVEPVGAAIQVSVTDHGPGIPAADRERVFEPFVQLDQSSTRRQGGTGLGLHLCRQLAELLGGRLELDETPRGGCRFTLELRDTARPLIAPVTGPGPLRGQEPEVLFEGALI